MVVLVFSLLISSIPLTIAHIKLLVVVTLTDNKLIVAPVNCKERSLPPMFNNLQFCYHLDTGPDVQSFEQFTLNLIKCDLGIHVKTASQGTNSHIR